MPTSRQNLKANGRSEMMNLCILILHSGINFRGTIEMQLKMTTQLPWNFQSAENFLWRKQKVTLKSYYFISGHKFSCISQCRWVKAGLNWYGCCPYLRKLWFQCYHCYLQFEQTTADQNSYDFYNCDRFLLKQDTAPRCDPWHAASQPAHIVWVITCNYFLRIKTGIDVE